VTSLAQGQPVLAVEDICKSFGPVQVLFNIDFALKRGEIHAVLGENGAGKSTLMKILSGYEQPSAGTIRLDGNPITIPDSGHGERLGIVLIHQEFALAEYLTVEENIFLGRELRRGWLLDKRVMRERTRTILRELDCRVDPDARVQDLAVSDKQMVEIAKAVSRDARVLIMDEPTAVLTRTETDVLFRLIRRLKARGVTVVYISHKLDEVAEISDRVTVLRDGVLIETRPTAGTSQDAMATLMVGRELSDLFPPKHPPPADAPTVLEVSHISTPGWVFDASFDLKRSEILGFAGLIGAGRTELMEAVLGLRRRTSGTIRRDGKVLRIRDMADAVEAGIVYLTEDRKGKGLLLDKQLRPNLTLMALERYGRFLLDEGREEQALRRAADEFDIRAKRLDALAGNLSGGNQQKLLLARTMQVDPEIIMIDEPTRGIDIGTKSQIYHFIHGLIEQGKSCIVVSSELQEIVGLAHRVVVMRQGRITGTLSGEEITEQEIVRYATGLKQREVASDAALTSA